MKPICSQIALKFILIVQAANLDYKSKLAVKKSTKFNSFFFSGSLGIELIHDRF